MSSCVSCDWKLKHDELKRRFDALLVDVENAEVDLKVKRREVSSLKAQVTRLTSRGVAENDIGRVFEHWRRVCGHPTAKLGEKRRNVVRARLREGYTPTQLCRAVDGCARSAFHMGQNDRRQRYDDLELICRNEVNVEKFLRLAEVAA